MITKISYEKGEKPNKHTLAPNEYFYNAKDGILYTIGQFGEVIEIGKQGGTISNFTSTGIDDNATSTAITIDDDENVGIGTTSPAQNLHVSASTDTRIALENTSNRRYDLISGDSGEFRIWDTAVGERMRIKSSGDVGIGTNAPTEKLDVVGNIKASSSFKTTGAILDQYGVKSGTYIASTGRLARTVVANRWYDTGISRSDGTNGAVYVLMGYLHTYASGFGNMWRGRFASSPIQWNTTSTNSSSGAPLAYGAIVGHAPDYWNEGFDRNERLQFRIKHEPRNALDGWRIQYRYTTSGYLDATSSGKEMQLWLKRIA